MSEKLNQDLRQLYEATENNMKLEIQKAVKNDISQSILKKKLIVISERTKEFLDTLVEDKATKEQLMNQLDKYNDNLIVTALNGFLRELREVKKLAKVKPLADAIFEQTQKGIDADLKIRVKGKTWSYKAYMEMNARTTVQQSIGEQQLESGKISKQVFYICDVFTNSADDHADWQGKMYYDERWKDFITNDNAIKEIQGIINKKRMKTVQYIRGKPIYLTTRPNCRHRLVPISLEQAGLSSDKILDDLKLKTASYKPENYEDLQKQRYNERMIRKYKARVESNEKLGYDTTSDKTLVRIWQARQRTLVNGNKTLERDYRRESNFVIVQDLGARYR